MIDLRSLLRSWHKNRKVVQDVLGYALQKDYGLTVSYKDLQGTDRVTVERIKNACSDLGFYVCLARLDHQVSGYCSHYQKYNDYWYSSYDEWHKIDETHDRTFALGQINELDGARICEHSSFSMKSLIQEGIFDYTKEPSDQQCLSPDCKMFYYRSVNSIFNYIETLC